MAILAITSAPAAFNFIKAELGAGECVTETRLATGLRRALEECWVLVLLDTEMAGDSVLELVRRVSETSQAIALVARNPTLPLTMDALDHGARDVLTLPPSPQKLRELIVRCNAIAGRPHLPEVDVLPLSDRIVGESESLLDTFKTVARVSRTGASVLIRGESGTGKEMVARTIHERSVRGDRAFVAVNCAAIPESLLESELFGHEKGAFTGAITRRIGRFERASGGTIFLDEIGDMSLPLQAKILRAVQEREIERIGGNGPIPIDVRLLAATHRDLEQEVELGRFRQDLYYRLAVVTVQLPSLRERGDDIRLLAEHYLAYYVREYGRTLRFISRDALHALRCYHWPGNVRQLRNVIESAVLLADGDTLLTVHLPDELHARAAGPAQEPGSLLPLMELERRHIQRVLHASGGRLNLAAELLGIHRNTLRRKIAEYGIHAGVTV